jgi:NAD(P)-dependent dehydrogenase (short-subunit alcohol dehydrogenase family)
MGLALGEHAAAAGARVTLMGRSSARLEAAAEHVPSAQRRVLDLSLPETIPAALEGLGPVDHLAVTAGTFVRGTIAQSGPEDWRRVLEERIVGPLTLIKALAPQLTTSVVLFAGTAARRPSVGLTLLAAACAGVEAAVRALAVELAPIRVNAVAPGAVDTPMLAGALGAHKEAAFAATAAKLPAGRIGAPGDAAQAAIFLMTNPFMTGATVEIDGGAHLV